MQLTTHQPITRRDRWGWYLYDFGSSAYAAVVLLAIYSAYFKDGVVGGERGTQLWGIAVGIAMLIVAVISPILGTIADHAGSKKRFLAFFTSISIIATALLFFVQQGDIFLGMFFFIIAEIGYRAAQVFYNGLLPEIAEEGEIGRISGTGWAIGSLGGILCLIIVLPLVVTLGDQYPNNLIVRSTLPITALFFALSAIPLFLWLKERTEPQRLSPAQLTIGFRQLAATARKARHYREYLKFLLSFVIYHDGVMITLNFAAIIGAVLYGFDQTELILLIILVQVTNVAGAYLFGVMADRRGSKRALTISIGMMIVVVIPLWFTSTGMAFYLIGSAAGFAMAGIQSVSRTMVSQLAPAGQSAEFYGLFAVAGRSSSFIGPTLFGIVAASATRRFLAQGMGNLAAEQLGIKVAVGTIILFLVIGGTILLTVNEKKHANVTQS